MYCSNCGAQNQDEAQFCGSCGWRLGPSAAATTEPGNVPGGLMAGSLVCAALALVFLPPILGGIAIYLGYRARKYNEGTGTTLMTVGAVATVTGMVIGAAIFVAAS